MISIGALRFFDTGKRRIPYVATAHTDQGFAYVHVAPRNGYVGPGLHLLFTPAQREELIRALGGVLPPEVPPEPLCKHGNVELVCEWCQGAAWEKAAQAEEDRRG